MQICSNGENELINQIYGSYRTDIKREEKNPFKINNIITNLNEINNVNNDNNNNNNKIEEEISEPNKNDIFKKKFETKLVEFGEYITQEQFNEKIPESILTYMSKNQFEIPNDININNELYEMNPIKFKNGNIYQGSWNENIVMDGFGKYYIEAGKIFIEGIWDNGKSIYGRIYYPNNNIYEGHINNSTCHGKGKILFESGDTYKGDFVDGEIEGEGIFTFSDKTTYEGKFVKGDFNGHGIMKWPFGTTYEGEFNGAYLNNYGKLYDNNGEVYEGNFKNNYYNGKGKYTFNDGSIYEGDFELGLRNGKGIYTKKDEFSFEGSWANDYPHGFGTYTSGDIQIKGIWRNGINAEISKFEGGKIDEFNRDLLNFKIPDINLIPERLPNLNKATNFRNFGYSNYPSYLNSKDNE